MVSRPQRSFTRFFHYACCASTGYSSYADSTSLRVTYENDRSTSAIASANPSEVDVGYSMTHDQSPDQTLDQDTNRDPNRTPRPNIFSIAPIFLSTTAPSPQTLVFASSFKQRRSASSALQRGRRAYWHSRSPSTTLH